jgi:hypothetical protein
MAGFAPLLVVVVSGAYTNIYTMPKSLDPLIRALPCAAKTLSALAFMKRFPVLMLPLLCLVLSSPAATAATLITTNSQASGQNWNGLIWKTNLTDATFLAPVAGNSYVAIDNGIPFANNANNTRLRNPAAVGVQTFPGASLTLNTNTEIRMKNAGAILNFPGVSGNPGLILNGGCLNTGDATTNCTLAGRVSVIAPSVFDFGNPTFGVVDTTRGAFLSRQLTPNRYLTF